MKRWDVGDIVGISGRTHGYGFSVVNEHRAPLFTLTYETEQRFIYTLRPLSRKNNGARRWAAEMGVSIEDGRRVQNRIWSRQSFDNQGATTKWLLSQATILKITALPKAVPPTSVLLPLGGVIPNEA